MFNSLSIKNSPLNKTIHIDFAPGINVLQGKNSSGKSTVIEMLNYSLFGSIALRSAISTYDKAFEVETVLTINNVIYKINRTTKDSQIYMFDTNSGKYLILATGITPVNEYLKGLLTYDYKIFSLTNFCKQHELLKLTSCSPKELVNLIEVVSGLDSSYKLLLSLKESRKECKAVIKSLGSTLDNSSSLNLDFQENSDYESLLKENTDVLNNFNRVLQNNYESSQTITNLYNTFIKIKNKRNKILSDLEEANSRIDSEYTEASLQDNKESILLYKNTLSSLNRSLSTYNKPDTTYSNSFLDVQTQLIEQNKEYEEYIRIKNKLEASKITCPNCEHSFHFESEDSLEPNQVIEVAPVAPVLTLREINNLRDWNAKVKDYNSLIEEIRAHEESYTTQLSTSFINDQLSLYETIRQQKSLLEYVDTEYSELLSNLESYVDIDQEDLEVSILNKVNEITNEYETSLEEFNNFKNYLDLKRQYIQQQDVIASFQDNLNTNKENLLTYNLLFDVLEDVKKTIQQESFPVLNSVASDILSQITGGERNKVFITDTFKIEVDDNDIDTIEGSGKVIANLALRVALLSTFYKDTFLVCLFDEIDESLHEDRFEYMEESFNKLAEQGYQLILSSHKNYSVDNIINMDSFKK